MTQSSSNNDKFSTRDCATCRMRRVCDRRVQGDTITATTAEAISHNHHRQQCCTMQKYTIFSRGNAHAGRQLAYCYLFDLQASEFSIQYRLASRIPFESWFVSEPCSEVKHRGYAVAIQDVWKKRHTFLSHPKALRHIAVVSGVVFAFLLSHGTFNLQLWKCIPFWARNHYRKHRSGPYGRSAIMHLRRELDQHINKQKHKTSVQIRSLVKFHTPRLYETQTYCDVNVYNVNEMV